MMIRLVSKSVLPQSIPGMQDGIAHRVFMIPERQETLVSEVRFAGETANLI
jgi:hypothetical protein